MSDIDNANEVGPVHTRIFTRRELYDLVWTQPMVTAAKQFNLSDVGLKKICTKHSIPVPARGYWARVAAGQQIQRTPLREFSGIDKIVIHGRPPQWRAVDALPIDAQKAITREREPAHRIEVGEALDRPHAVTRLTEKILRGSKPDKFGMLLCENERVFRVKVAVSTIPRVVSIVDALLKACVKRGFEIRDSSDPSSPSASLVLGGEEVDFAIVERSKQIDHIPTQSELEYRRKFAFWPIRKFDYRPSGDLVLTITQSWGDGIRCTWKETATQKLEDCLNDAVAGLLAVAHHRKQQRILNEEQSRLAELKAEARRQRELAEEAERDALERLEAEAERWRRAQAIREYADAIERSNGSADPRTTERIRWARAQADRLDPLTKIPG